MKRRRVFGVLFSGLVLASTVAAPSAVAVDPCRWIAHDLPLPFTTPTAGTTGSSENNRFIIGEAEFPGRFENTGLVWDNGALTAMASTGSLLTQVHPKDVNNSGVVVGRHDFAGSNARYAAFRYRNGAYEMLDTPANHSSQAIAVNNLGDVVGEIWDNASPGARQIVVWPAAGPRKSFRYGQAVGISDDRRIVQVNDTDSTSYVIDVESGFQTELHGARTPIVLDNDRVLAYTDQGMKEWTTDGEQVATWAGAFQIFGRTSGGHVVFGSDGGGNAMLWQWGIRYAVDSEKQPRSLYRGDISDEGALIGTYENADGSSHPARWFWCG